MTWDQLQTDEKAMWRTELVTRAFIQRAQHELENARRATVDNAADATTSIDDIRFQAGVQAGMDVFLNLLENG